MANIPAVLVQQLLTLLISLATGKDDVNDSLMDSLNDQSHSGAVFFSLLLYHRW